MYEYAHEDHFIQLRKTRFLYDLDERHRVQRSIEFDIMPLRIPLICICNQIVGTAIKWSSRCKYGRPRQCARAKWCQWKNRRESKRYPITENILRLDYLDY